MTSTENRNLYTCLSEIEATSYGRNLSVMLKNRSVDIGFETVNGDVVLNQAEFADLCDSDDVSLSRTERVELESYLCSVAEGN